MIDPQTRPRRWQERPRAVRGILSIVSRRAIAIELAPTNLPPQLDRQLETSVTPTSNVAGRRK